MDIIAREGLEALSLRAVARRLGVSHQAPYKHFPTRDHLLAEVIRLCLKRFAGAMRSSGAPEAGHRALSPQEALDALGAAYLDYAVKNPLEYRLMFGTRWPEIAHEVDLNADAKAAFDVLRERLAALLPVRTEDELDLDALFVWSTIHGIATLLQSDAMTYLGFERAKVERGVGHAKDMIDRALAAREGPHRGAGD